MGTTTKPAPASGPDHFCPTTLPGRSGQTPALASAEARTRQVVIVAWLLFWALMVSVSVQDYVRDGDGRAYWQPVLWESSSMIAASLLLAVQLHFTRRHNGLLARPARWFALQAAWLPVYWLAFVPIAFGIRHGVYALAGQVYEHQAWAETFVYESVKLTVFVGMFCLIRFGILSYQQLLAEKLRVETASALLRQAQLQRLAQQMQPHFLFNALNTISSLMHSDVARADATLIQLAQVLRTTLEVSDLHVAPLSTELRLAQGYARVMQERYADRVTLAWDIDPAALDCSVPVMSLQPLIENVFKHTVERRRQSTAITVMAQHQGERLLLRVADDAGMLAPPSQAGIGLANLRERLGVLYGANARFSLTERVPAGVLAELDLPC